MYLFYDLSGRIISSSTSSSPNDKLTYIPDGLTALYLDDNQHQDIIYNTPNYTIIDAFPVYTPISDLEKLPFIQQAKIDELNLACNQEILGGFSSSCNGVKHKYKFSLEWQNNFNRQMNSLILDLTINEIEWNTTDVGVIKLTREQFITLYKDSKRFIDDKMSRYYYMKELIMNYKSIDDVKLINW